MTNTEFVSRLRKVVYDSAVAISLAILREPLGQRPSQMEVDISQWFNHLSPNDKDRVRQAIELAARTTAFQMLAMIDGVNPFRESLEETPGSFELRYNTGGNSFLLNAPSGDFLHDLFAEEVPPP